ITYAQIPPRPTNRGRGTIRDDQQHASTSSPENRMNGNASPGQNDAGAVPGSEDDRTIRLGQQGYNPSMYAPESGTTRPFQHTTMPRSGVVQQDQTSSRFAAIITVLILLATLILLGFSVYLAVQLG